MGRRERTCRGRCVRWKRARNQRRSWRRARVLERLDRFFEASRRPTRSQPVATSRADQEVLSLGQPRCSRTGVDYPREQTHARARPSSRPCNSLVRRGQSGVEDHKPEEGSHRWDRSSSGQSRSALRRPQCYGGPPLRDPTGAMKSPRRARRVSAPRPCRATTTRRCVLMRVAKGAGRGYGP